MRSLFDDTLAALTPALQRLGIKWYLFGAQAAFLYGVRRLTADIDVTVHLGDHTTQELVLGLKAAGFRLRVEDDDFIDRTRVLPLVHASTGTALDIVLAGPGLEELFLERAVTHDIGGVRIPVARAEDVVTMKILAGRPKDFDDVYAILKVGGSDLDLDLVRTTLTLLEQALDQSDLMPAFERVLDRAQGDAASH